MLDLQSTKNEVGRWHNECLPAWWKPIEIAEALIAEVERMQHAFEMVADVEAGYYHLQHEVERLQAENKQLRGDMDTAFHCYGRTAKMLDECREYLTDQDDPRALELLEKIT